MINEVLNYGLSQYHYRGRPVDAFLCIDEFQRFLGPDIYDFLPIIRNMGIHLMLAHQSFHQLVQGEIDLRPLIPQCRTRLVFAKDFEDANLLAEEFASLRWDPHQVKHEQQSFRQRIVGHKKIILEAWSSTHTATSGSSDQQSAGASVSRPDKPDSHDTKAANRGSAHVDSASASDAQGQSAYEQLVPVHEDFFETTKVDFVSREEVVHEWQQRIRSLDKGEALVKIVEDPAHYRALVDYLPPDDDPAIDRAVEELKAQNYAEGPFITAAQADDEHEAARQRVLAGPTMGSVSRDRPPRIVGDAAGGLLP